MAAKKKRSQKTRASSAPRFFAMAIGSVANMIAVAATSGVVLAGFLVVKRLV